MKEKMKEIKSYLKTSLKLKAQPTIELNDLETLVAYIDQQDQIIREAREYVKNNIEFCENDSQGAYEKCNIRILSDKKLLEILDRNVNNEKEIKDFYVS